MRRYFIAYGDYGEYWTCLADGPRHAIEQFRDEVGDEHIHAVYRGVSIDFTDVYLASVRSER